ncbi:MAG: hypothetical protein HZA89_03145 [Verrucomicrobia bacterium]|nr:hypothetical protein [Verrucomicrobiota bacterium]
MQPSLNVDEVLEKIVAKDPRYTREAYFFVREALDYTQKIALKSTKGEFRHVTGQELLGGIRQFALEQFGPMTLTVLDEWGVRRCEDFGELVFNMVDNSLLGKTETDSREDFKGGYDFEEAFRRPFLPKSRLRVAEPDAKPASS